MSDTVLIEKAKSGNEHAFRLLVEKYRHHLFHTIYAILRDEKEAEDALQEVLVKVYYSLPEYENKGLKTWLTRIAVNYAIDFRRKKIRQSEDIVDALDLQQLSAEGQTVEKQLIKKERQQLIHNKIDTIPENYRDVIYGFYIEGKSYQQMASEQNVQIKTIETKLYRARQWLKKHWQEDDFL